MKTKRGIYLDLSESEYYYEFNNNRYFFSSLFYLKNFKEKIKNYVQNETNKITIKYKVKFDNVDFLALSLYRKIEKRGERIEKMEV